MPEESQTKGLESGGILRDGFKGYGQYCLIHERNRGSDIRYTFNDALAKCADLGGTLPTIKSFDEALPYHKIDCSKLNPDAERCSDARSVSYFLSNLHLCFLYIFVNLRHLI